MQTGRERLLEPYEQVPRPELPTVRMPGKLEVESRGGRRRGGPRLMSEQDSRSRIGRRTQERGHGVAALCGIEMMRAVVRYSGDYKGRPSVPNDDVLIQKHAQSQSRELRRPCTFPRVVLMISRDEKRAMARAQPSEWSDVPREIGYRAVDQVTRDRDEIRIQTVHGIDDCVDVLLLNLRTDVNVADLGDREAV